MKINRWFTMAATTLALTVATSALAQQDGGRPRFDPAQMRERMMERYKEMLEVTDDQEWRALQPMIEKVTQARMQSMPGRGMMFGGRRGPGGRQGGPGGDQANERRFGPAPSPEAEALQRAIDSKASKAELKAAIAKYQESRKQQQAELEKAQEDLRKVLTARQEAIATMAGLL